MARGAGKNGWALFLLILAGVVLGSFISQLTSGVAGLIVAAIIYHFI